MTSTTTTTCPGCQAQFCWLGVWISGRPVKRGKPQVYCTPNCAQAHGARRRRANGCTKTRDWYKGWLARKGMTTWEYMQSVPSHEARDVRQRAYSAKRQALKDEQIVALTKEEKRQVHLIYKEMKRLNREAGYIAYHVDHIIPLSKGGLHHPDNLQILTAQENLSKGNRL